MIVFTPNTVIKSTEINSNFDELVTAQVQYVYANRNTALDATNQIIPVDDTIPQNTEGVECATLSITPKFSTSRLVIEFSGFMYGSVAAWITTAIFVDSQADAIGATTQYLPVNTQAVLVPIKLTVSSNSTTARTYKVRIGSNTNIRLTLNGNAGGRWFGDIPKSFISITEYK